jgi:flagellar biosynthetic protein FlhB
MVGLPAIFSTSKLVNAFKGCALAIVLGTIGALYLKAHVSEFAAALAMPLEAGIAYSARAMVGGMVLLLLVLAACALIDVPLQRFQYAQSLKMSHAELKQEQKESEGSKEVKGKMRARMRQMAKRRMMAAVPTADLVVMNPTHYAVALRYVQGEDAAPICVAKGMDAVALRIRALAEENNVPVIEDPPLARGLYASVEIDDVIPREHFEAVARIIGFIFAKGRERARPARARALGL